MRVPGEPAAEEPEEPPEPDLRASPEFEEFSAALKAEEPPPAPAPEPAPIPESEPEPDEWERPPEPSEAEREREHRCREELEQARFERRWSEIVRCHHQMALLLASQRRTEEALFHARLALGAARWDTVDPVAWIALDHLIRMLLVQGHFEEARQRAEEAVSLAEREADQARLGQALRRRAEVALSSGDVERAATDLRAARERLRPGSPEALAEQDAAESDLCAAQGDPAGERACLERIITHYRNAPALHFGLSPHLVESRAAIFERYALALEAAGKTDEAAQVRRDQPAPPGDPESED